jgi:hypothetical protein
MGPAARSHDHDTATDLQGAPMRTRILAIAVLAALSLHLLAIPALAHHTHVLQIGDGRCVVLAEWGGERFVELPDADEFASNRRHPLHTKVHLGEPGMRDGVEVIWVKGSPGDQANCTSYANARPARGGRA